MSSAAPENETVASSVSQQVYGATTAAAPHKKRKTTHNRNNNNYNSRKATKTTIPMNERANHNTISTIFELPMTLKTILVDEWTHVMRLQHVHEIPAAVPIHTLLQHYLKQDDTSSNLKHSSRDDAVAVLFCQGLVTLFRESLSVCLLYPQERAQYELVRNKSKLPVEQLYGCEFLLRLIVRLPLLRYDPTPAQATILQALIVLMQKNRIALFGKNKYIEASDCC
jgi:hypothetical protein